MKRKCIVPWKMQLLVACTIHLLIVNGLSTYCLTLKYFRIDPLKSGHFVMWLRFCAPLLDDYIDQTKSLK